MPSNRYLSDAELDLNYEAFKAALPELIKKHKGRFAIIRDANVLDAFDTSRDAFVCGWRLFGDDLFSVQEVTDEPVYLGIFSHAIGIGPS
jgi:hypothetical protein